MKNSLFSTKKDKVGVLTTMETQIMLPVSMIMENYLVKRMEIQRVSSVTDEVKCFAAEMSIVDTGAGRLQKASLPPEAENTVITSSKVTPQPIMATGTPRLVRSRAVRRDLVRNWNFDEVVMER
ncbi:hypothetical protein HHK36_007855 [Tetracentron sinense]|uniref:Uncharacterized protein n=1 Tax=Tetracentron sinense TaxID=13715 RepID=A0A834ZFE9_TETSI|nr:hypothetical protein HHK36_007855 [Tetracentron sinense]